VDCERADVMKRARRRIAWRLLPFVFVLYLISMIDRFNISFAALRMKSELGFSDSVYGLGASLFFVTYFAFEIPGAVIAERWSVRKWIGRIMVSWGVITILTASIQGARQFYAARLLLGTAEASFFPTVIIYLTRWFTLKDRARAIAAFYAASPVSAFVGSALAGWVLPVHWMGMSGWRWLFVIEGAPAVVVGFIAVFYLTDRPGEATWLTEVERFAIVKELATEHAVKVKLGGSRFWGVCKEPRFLLLLIGYFFYIMSVITNTLWMPTFIQRLSPLPAATVAKLVMMPAAAGVLGLFINSWRSDRSGERKWHTVIPIVCSGFCYLLIGTAGARLPVVVLMFSLYYFFANGAFASLWAMPTTFLSATTAAAAFGLINSAGQMGGFFGPSIVGYLNDATHSIDRGLVFISCSLLISAFTFSFLPSTSAIYGERIEPHRPVAFEPDISTNKL
jgi:MFS transporter, ACS family, tartrate transporter